ncbi:serine-rich adhesin for platelets-like isoform X2 [Gigantopelta aegis]|uniref:serine-rich adhesin for platelets-like isoform X2 n=1 Tax=Gigantopelta aegis TaxID=1735272 RepID=UPI001B889D3D|nr:serine-rich adhesin for platelets-like isoform X2 [Gigantopelta aegis]
METVKVPGILPLLMIATFCIIADQASGKRACQQLPGSASSQVINMCEDNAASSSDRFYLDVFSNSSTSLSCVCFLQVRGLVEIDFKQNIISGDSCLTTITIYSQNTSQHVFSCRNDSLATTATLATGSSALELKTSTTSQESASCLQLYRKGGTGSLRVECISPAANTTTSRPTTSAASSSTSSSTSDSTSSTSDSTSSTSGSTSRATSDSITSNSYSTNSSSQSTSSISDFTSSTSGSTSTSTRDSTQSDDFPGRDRPRMLTPSHAPKIMTASLTIITLPPTRALTTARSAMTRTTWEPVLTLTTESLFCQTQTGVARRGAIGYGSLTKDTREPGNLTHRSYSNETPASVLSWLSHRT